MRITMVSFYQYDWMHRAQDNLMSEYMVYLDASVKNLLNNEEGQ